ncbi:MAG: carboxypeptidase-like regulatory domain-containing protein [Novipirellula sp. JB048]
MKQWNLMIGLALLASVIGCGSSGLPTGNVAGNVTQAGAPLAAGTVTLLNSETGVGASAELDPTGGYRVESVRTGEYQVAIQPPGAPSPEEMEAGIQMKNSTIPDPYRDPQTSGFRMVVSQGENTADFDIP